MRKTGFRGFCEAETGKEIIFLNKQEVRGCWVFGSLVIKKDDRPFIWDKNEDILVPVLPQTVGEYSGKEDKSGTPIYEGDIIDYNCMGIHHCAEVKFEGGSFFAEGYTGDVIKHLHPFVKDCGTWAWTVIGNIYSNQDLLRT